MPGTSFRRGAGAGPVVIPPPHTRAQHGSISDNVSVRSVVRVGGHRGAVLEAALPPTQEPIAMTHLGVRTAQIDREIEKLDQQAQNLRRLVEPDGVQAPDPERRPPIAPPVAK
jgi:hypothetical protein